MKDNIKVAVFILPCDQILVGICHMSMILVFESKEVTNGRTCTDVSLFSCQAQA